MPNGGISFIKTCLSSNHFAIYRLEYILYDIVVEFTLNVAHFFIFIYFVKYYSIKYFYYY